MGSFDLTLEEKMDGAVGRTREKVAELHFYEINQPHYPMGYSVFRRNDHHWDISAKECPGRTSAWLAANPGGRTSGKDGQTERAFRIRGEPGNVVVHDERWNPTKPYPREPMIFKSIMGAMVYISEELMQEPPVK